LWCGRQTPSSVRKKKKTSTQFLAPSRLVQATIPYTTAMIVVQSSPTGFTEEVIAAEKRRVTEFFAARKEECRWESVLYQADPKSSVGFHDENPCEVLLGGQFLEETLLGKKFRISPTSFFQTNTKAAEVLYTKIGDCCTEGNNETVLLDLCCGTGTIGLTLASRMKKVIGVEMVHTAIEDAKINAALNGITNVEFFANKVEDVIESIIRSAGDAPIVAVVDPPRSGLRECLPFNF